MNWDECVKRQISRVVQIRSSDGGSDQIGHQAFHERRPRRPAMRYWINTISRDHVTKGVQGGFTQAGHGSRTGLNKLSEGDFIIFYSPRASIARSSSAVQQFTALGRITDSTAYQVEVSSTFRPFRRKMEFTRDIKSVDVRPFIDKLEFIKDKKHWGIAFRTGLFPISQKDYELISKEMTSK